MSSQMPAQQTAHRGGATPPTVSPSQPNGAHPMRIDVDHGVCQLYANCVVEAPENFDLDESGALVVESQVDEAHEDDARRAQLMCPVKAITLVV